VVAKWATARLDLAVPELPDHLDLSVTLGGQPLAGAWAELRLPMERKHDYLLMVGPTDAAGTLSVSRAELEDQISVIQLSAFMDYSSLGVWRGQLVISAFDAEAIERAEVRQRGWAKDLLKTYPADFSRQLAELAQRLADQPGSVLEVSAEAHGGEVALSCVPRSS
jgi:hypothetical protein